MGGPRQESSVDCDWVIRARRYDHALSDETPVDATVFVYPRPRALEIDTHAGIEVGVSLAGRSERRFSDSTSFLARPGDVWLTAMWEPHGWRILEPDTKVLVLIFRPDFLGEEMLGDMPWLSLFAALPAERPRVRSHKLRQMVLDIGQEIEREIEAEQRGWISAVKFNLLRLLLALARGWRMPSGQGVNPGARVTNLARVMPALTALHAQPSHRLTVSEAASACGLSASQFNRVFQETMGLSFAKFCLRSRLAYAAHRLLATRQSLDAIAEEAGFVDASHLHHTFIRQYGLTPGVYRQRSE